MLQIDIDSDLEIERIFKQITHMGISIF